MKHLSAISLPVTSVIFSSETIQQLVPSVADAILVLGQGILWSILVVTLSKEGIYFYFIVTDFLYSFSFSAGSIFAYTIS